MNHLTLLIISAIYFFLLGSSRIQSFPKMIPKKVQGPSFSAKLIHRSHPDNPFFNQTYSWEEFIEDGATDSITRSYQLGQLGQANYEVAPLRGWAFIMQYSMGTPPVDRYGIFDTGSSLIWFQCSPCIHCYQPRDSPEGYTIFDPIKSSSYRRLRCDEPRCTSADGLKDGTCSATRHCRYYYKYADEAETRGYLSTESINIASLSGNDGEESVRILKDVIFGCGDKNYDLSGLPGVFGVGNHKISFIRQLNYPQFSYYVYANSTSIGGVVHFGEGTGLLEADFTTPMIPNPRTGHYYLQLEGIRVNDDPVYIPPGAFTNSKDGRNGFVIDSGTTFSSLVPAVFDELVQDITDQMQVDFSSLATSYSKKWRLCYWDVSGAPQVEFEFTGIVFRLCGANQWVKMPNGIYCLAIQLSNSNSGLSILGSYQQRNVMVGFDLQKNLLSLLYPDSCPNDPLDFYRH